MNNKITFKTKQKLQSAHPGDKPGFWMDSGIMKFNDFFAFSGISNSTWLAII